MAEFKFRLATLLRLRETTRDERRAELAAAYRADQVLQRQLTRLSAELRELKAAARRAAGPGRVNVEQLVEAQRYQQTIESRQRQVNEERAALAAEIERRRQALLAAEREVRTLEKLRETRHARHRQDENRREIKQLDEVATLLALR
jgi:flagellar export protein FliJ